MDPLISNFISLASQRRSLRIQLDLVMFTGKKILLLNFESQQKLRLEKYLCSQGADLANLFEEDNLSREKPASVNGSSKKESSNIVENGKVQSLNKGRVVLKDKKSIFSIFRNNHEKREENKIEARVRYDDFSGCFRIVFDLCWN